MNYLKHLIFELRERPLVTWITIAGTALSIFFLMAVYVSESMNSLEMSPESKCKQILYAPYVYVTFPDGSASGAMSSGMAHRLYDNIDGIEKVSFFSNWMETKLVSNDGINNYSYKEKRVDSDFWNIFDYAFISGSPFTRAEVDAGVKEVILSESVALDLGKGADLLGRDILINYIPHRVKGIVRDPSPLLKNSWSQIWTAWKDSEEEGFRPEIGSTSVFLLMKSGADKNAIKQEVKRRYDIFNAQNKKNKTELVYTESPYTQKEQQSVIYSNQTPDFKSSHRKKIALYIILLLLPAINLSGMTRSRLRRRISEIGVRRAYGATRGNIISQLIGENFLLTLTGGLLGLILCMIFTLFFSHLFIDYISDWNIAAIQANARPSFSMLFNWSIFFMALVFCFILNIISTGIPAWKASRVNPAEAISGKNS